MIWWPAAKCTILPDDCFFDISAVYPACFGKAFKALFKNIQDETPTANPKFSLFPFFLFSKLLFLFSFFLNTFYSLQWVGKFAILTKPWWKWQFDNAKIELGEVSKSQFLDFRINLKPEMVVKVTIQFISNWIEKKLIKKETPFPSIRYYPWFRIPWTRKEI